MGLCIVCGNESPRSFDVMYNGGILTFDTFQCAIHRLAPACGRCDCLILGHAVEGEDGVAYCCASCLQRAQGQEVPEAADTVRSEPALRGAEGDRS